MAAASFSTFSFNDATIYNNLTMRIDEENDVENTEQIHQEKNHQDNHQCSLITKAFTASSSLLNFVNKAAISEVFKVATLTIGISAADLKLTPFITNVAINHLGLCVDNLVSSRAKNFISYIVNPLARLNQSLGNLLGQNITGKILIPAALEEMEFRWLIQDIALKKIPEKILKYIAPQYAHIVDSNAARISRIALAALIFSICHLHLLDCSGGGGIEPLIGGLIYGYVYEYTNWSLFGCINLHSIYNLLNFSDLI
jgi:hypothetical protein